YELRLLPACSGAQQVGEQSIRTRNEFGELAIERIRDVDISAPSGMCDDESAALRVLALIRRFSERCVARVPRVEERVAALFYPAVKVSGGDFVRPTQKRVCGVEQFDGCLFVDHVGAIDSERKRSREGFGLILDDQRSAAMNEIIKMRLRSCNNRAGGVGANAHDNHVP